MIKKMKYGKPLFGDEDVGIVEDEQVFTPKPIPELNPSDNRKDIHSNQELEAIKRAERLTNEDIDTLKEIVKVPKKETIIRGRHIEEELI